MTVGSASIESNELDALKLASTRDAASTAGTEACCTCVARAIASLRGLGWISLVYVAWTAVGLVVTVQTLVRPESHTVFPVFAGGALHWWQDQSLYERYGKLDYFRYSPTFAIAMTPFAYLGNRAGGILWSWLNLAVYFWGLRRFIRDVLPGKWPPVREAAFLLLALIGAARGLWNAQSNALVIGLFMLAASALIRERWWKASFLLTGPVLLKLSPLAIVLLCCALWPRKLAGRFAVALAIMALVPFLTRPPEIVAGQYQAWIAHLRSTAEFRWGGLRDGWTLWLVVQNCFQESTLDVIRTPIQSTGYRCVQWLAAAATLVWCLWQKRQSLARRQLLTVTLGMGMAWLMIFGPSTEFPTYVLLVPLLAWAFLESIAQQRGRIIMAGSFSCVLVLPWNGIRQLATAVVPPLIAALPIGSILFAVWLVGYARRSATRDELVRPLLLDDRAA